MHENEKSRRAAPGPEDGTGPGGGSDAKPVGLVWIGVSSQKSTETFSMVFKGDRKRNIERFAANALNILRKKLVNELNN